MKTVSFTAAFNDFHLIILNQTLDLKFMDFWNASKLKIVADGAANLLYQYNPSLVPDFIIGDFDSISGDVLEYYEQRCKALRIRDQDSTDFQKCIKIIVENGSGGDQSAIFAIGALSGRLDHTMSCLHTLLKYPDKKIFLISADSIATLISSGETTIYCEKVSEGKFEITCAATPSEY
jgi:thiamine pyrophosphokinase